VSEAKQYLAEGQFPPGSMGPKIEAAIAFVESGGDHALITSIDAFARGPDHASGTRVIAG
jgi:carbamate kinase